MPERDPAEYRPRPESSTSWTVAAVVAVAVAAGAAWWFWWRPAQAPAPVVAPPPEAAAPAPMAEASGPQHPIAARADAGPLPPLAESDAWVAKALGELLGAERVGRFLLTDGFVRRAVATVDNLPRAQAPARLWPVQPAPQRFLVEGPPGAQAIAPANAARYQSFVAFAEAVPPDAAVALYARLYPLFQAAYEELGYPGKYFNDRLVAVLDHLLAAPAPQGPLAVQLTQVRGEVPSTRPWVRYEFADPQLEALSSGQKMLVRMGPDNARRLKAVLAELRRRVATGEVARRPAQ
ncbi:DUF3014 domain-containing protein [Alicycliphilus denitrificans]|uniref:DUF3014 domain-containing protein n=1 Tax=Alicycliphilus denitrificans TaxID=179636 RepID=UPI003A7FFEC1